MNYKNKCMGIYRDKYVTCVCFISCVGPPRKRLDSSVNNSQVLLERVRSHSVGSPFSNSVSELPQVATSP